MCSSDLIQGQETTLPVSLDEMIYHTRAVRTGSEKALLMVDMPFMADATPEQALHSAGRLMKEGGAQMVKLEGGSVLLETVQALAARGIPVCSHLGLLPQSVHKQGGYRVQGRDGASALDRSGGARAMQADGAGMLLLECVPATLAAEITGREGHLDVPVNNAGRGWLAPLGDFPERGWDKVMDLNVKSPFFLTQQLIPRLTSRATKERTSSVINIGSIAGQEVYQGGNVYCATKFAVRGYTEVLMAELDDSHIQVHLVHPGGIDTNIVRGTTVEEEARALLTTPPGEVARKVIDAIRKNRRRVVFGNMARPARFMSNFVPVGLVAKVLRRGA